MFAQPSNGTLAAVHDGANPYTGGYGTKAPEGGAFWDNRATQHHAV